MTQKTWPELAAESWMLGMEAGTVIWLRTLRLMAGGPLAEREASRMVSEKVISCMALLPAIAAGGPLRSAEDAAARALAHYRKPVRANRRRLSR